MRAAKLYRFFWEQVADQLGMSEVEYPTGDREVFVRGVADGLRVSLGAWSSRKDAPVECTVISVEMEGLPPGLEIDGVGSVSFSGVVEPVVCEGRTRKVSVVAVPMDLGGLRLVQTPIDLNEWLTPARRDAVCALRNDLYFLRGRHYVRCEKKGLPYPPTRILKRSMSGDPDATRALRASCDLIALTVRETLSDARTFTALLSDGIQQDR